MLYQFAARDGSMIEREYPIGTAPKIGCSIRVKGKRYQRLPSIGLQGYMPNDLPKGMTSTQLPFNWPFAPRHDARGRPQFENFREVKEAMARARQHGETIDWE